MIQSGQIRFSLSQVFWGNKIFSGFTTNLSETTANSGVMAISRSSKSGWNLIYFL